MCNEWEAVGLIEGAWRLLAIVAACRAELGVRVNNIFPTQLPGSCDVCNVHRAPCNVKSKSQATEQQQKLLLLLQQQIKSNIDRKH